MLSSSNRIGGSITNFECTTCGASFETGEELADHIESAHESEKMGDFECGVCGERFETKEELVDHTRVAHAS